MMRDARKPDVEQKARRIFDELVVFVGATFVPGLPEVAVQLMRNVAMGYMVLMLTLALTAMLSAANMIYSATPVAKDRPLKGFVQLVQIVIWIFGGVMIIEMSRTPINDIYNVRGIGVAVNVKTSISSR